QVLGGGSRSGPAPGGPAGSGGAYPAAGPYGPGHRGVDLAARPGTEVLAAATGRVSFAGRVAGRGVLVIELAGSGAPPLRTTYEPVRALVAKGDDVVAGRPVGVLEAGPFHCAAGCLHWGLRRGDAYLDPLSLLPPALLRRGPSRLLPVFGVPEPGAAVAPVAAPLSRVRRAGSSRRRCRR
ncbi:M23 family metallopeptidase, partial [Streptomyces sp. MBT57]|nr:M23 family metallopeptidase [Streptomyces sp. MBT57]